MSTLNLETPSFSSPIVGNNPARLPSTAFDVRLEISERKIRAMRRPRTSPSIRQKQEDLNKQKLFLVGSSANNHTKYILDESYCDEQQPSVEKELHIASVDETHQERHSPPRVSSSSNKGKRNHPPIPRPKSSKLPAQKNVGIGERNKYPFRPLSALVRSSSSKFGHSESPLAEYSEFSVEAGNSQESLGEIGDLIGQSMSTIEPNVAAVEFPPPRRYGKKDNFFYDMWITSQGGMGGELDPFNLELMSKFQGYLAKITQDFEGHVQIKEGDAEIEAGSIEASKPHIWDLRYVKYLKALSAVGIGALDVLAAELGHKYPLLADIRDSLLPALYFCKSEEIQGVDKTPLENSEFAQKVEEPKADLDVIMSEYESHESFVEKWFQDSQRSIQTQQTYESLLKTFQSMSSDLTETQQQLAEKKSLLDKAQRSRDKFSNEIMILQRDHDRKVSELSTVKYELEQEKSSVSLLESKNKKMSSERENLFFTITSHELKIKELEGKIIDCSTNLEKIRKESADLKRERRDLKQELGELQDSTKRQSVMLNTERVRNRDMLSTLHDLLYRSFQSFVDVVTPGEKDKEKGEKVNDPLDSLIKMYDQSRAIIERVNHQRIAIQESNNSHVAKIDYLTKELEKTKKDNEESVAKMQLDHKLELQTIMKSNAAVQESLRKAALKKEVEKTALQSMLHAVREEASALKIKIKELINDYESRISILTTEINLLDDRLRMKCEDHQMERIITDLKAVIDKKNCEIKELQTLLRNSEYSCSELNNQLRQSEHNLNTFIIEMDIKMSKLNDSHSKELNRRENIIRSLDEHQSMLAEDVNENYNRRVSAETQIIEHTAEYQRMKSILEAQILAISGELAAAIKELRDAGCQTELSGDISPPSPDVKSGNTTVATKLMEENSPKTAIKLSVEEQIDMEEQINMKQPIDRNSDYIDESHEKQSSSANKQSCGNSESDSDSSDSSFSKRTKNLQRNNRRNATFFDKKYVPVETNHFNNPEAWQYFAERLSEERNKFQELVGYLNLEKKKIKNDMAKFGKVIEDLKVKLPQQILLHINQISRINLTQIISSEINRRVSTIQVPAIGAQFSAHSPLPAINEQIISDELSSPQKNQNITELEAKELIKVGKTLNKMLGLKSDGKAKKGISFDLSNASFDEDDEEEGSSKRKGILQIEYANPDKMKKKQALRSIISSKFQNKGTQTTENHHRTPTRTSDISQIGGDSPTSDLNKAMVENTMRSLFPHRLRSDVQLGSEKLVSPHQLSQPFLGFIRKNEKIFSRECSLLKVALRECKAFFDRLLTQVMQRMNAVATSNTRQNQNKAISRREKELSKLKLRNVREILAELREVQTSIQSHQWLFDSKLFTRKFCDHPVEDPIDVASQAQILSSYQELLLEERLHHETLIKRREDTTSSDAVIRALEDLITDLTVRLHSNGGWRSLFYRTDGTFDVELDPCGFPLEEQVEINAEKVRYLQRKLTSNTEDHNRSVNAFHHEIATLQDCIQELKLKLECESNNSQHQIFDDLVETKDQGCNTDCKEVLILSRNHWETMLENLRLVSISLVENFQLSTLSLVEPNNLFSGNNDLEEKSWEAISTLIPEDDLEEIERARKLKSLTEVASLITQNRKTPILPSMNPLDDKYVSFVKPRPLSAVISKNTHMTPSKVSSAAGIATNKSIHDVKAKQRPWISAAWRQVENVTKTKNIHNIASESNLKSNSLKISGISKQISGQGSVHPSTEKLVSLLEYNNDDRLSIMEPVLCELLKLSTEMKTLLTMANRKMLKENALYGSIITKHDFEDVVQRNSQLIKKEEVELPALSKDNESFLNNFSKEEKAFIFDDEIEFGSQKLHHISSEGCLRIGEDALEGNGSALLQNSMLSNTELGRLSPSMSTSRLQDGAQGILSRNQNRTLTVSNASLRKEDTLLGSSKGPRNAMYENLISSVYKITKEREHSDMMKYALVMYDRYQQYHEEAKRMKDVLITLQNSHQVFEDRDFLVMIQQKSLNDGKSTSKNLKLEDKDLLSKPLRVPISTALDPKKYKQFLDKKHKGFTRSHVTIHSTELSMTRCEEKSFKGLDITKDITKVADEREMSSAELNTDETRKRDDDSDFLHNYNDIVRQSLNFLDSPDEMSLTSIQSNKKSKVQKTIEVARQHYDNPLSTVGGNSSNISITQAIEPMNFDRPLPQAISSSGPALEEQQRFVERQVIHQATQWSKSLSDMT